MTREYLIILKKWYELQQIKLDFPFKSKYIVYPDISSTVNFTFAKDVLYDMTCFGIPSSSNSLLGILNSKLIESYLNTVCVKARGGYLRLKSQYILNIPIPNVFESEPLNKAVESIMQVYSQLSAIESEFVNLIISKSGANKISRVLQNWVSVSQHNFLIELSKLNIVSNLSEESEWLNYFNEQKAMAENLKFHIEKIEIDIDTFVYDLYNLTESEIKIVEDSI